MSIKIFSFLFVFACCFTTVNANTELFACNTIAYSNDSTHDIDKSTIRTDSFTIHSKDYERVITQHLGTTTPLFIKHTKTDSAILNHSSYLFALVHTKYIQYLKACHLNFITTDIIYPFHAFW
ncbi:hypothetical protein [Bizionia paragorgiae]|uniref:Uncharacterized protein n=1 Tax=Bizionia paragorgiae TaxID=283786 RepID=A0A1H3Y3I4_BIZPA|nr:hypothetical protein [Bizionia paragorgiae]SEA06209.1 hypothetical protein SAMN04487990_10637 [Bizionia paragorgiae]